MIKWLRNTAQDVIGNLLCNSKSALNCGLITEYLIFLAVEKSVRIFNINLTVKKIETRSPENN